MTMREPPYRMLVLDLDGTLLTDDKQIAPQQCRAVDECRAAGVRVILASARPPRSTRFASEILNLDEPVINYNGALVQNPFTGELLLNRPIPRSTALELLGEMARIGGSLIPSVEIMDKWYTARIVEELMYGIETARAGFRPTGVGPLEQFIDQDVTKVFTLGDPGDLERVRQLVEAGFAGRLTTTKSDNIMLQIMDARAGKVEAVEFLCRGRGFGLDRVAAVGDNYNDIELIRAAGLGIAMGNAPEPVRAAADRVTKSNAEHGVDWAVRQWVLPQE